MHKLQSHGAGKPVYDNNADTLSASYHAGTGTLQMYAIYFTSTGPGGSLEYHTTQTGGNFIIGSRDQFLQGATHFRNGRDLTMKWRDQLISAANERARSMNADQSTLEPSNYNGVLDAADAYPVKKSQTIG